MYYHVSHQNPNSLKYLILSSMHQLMPFQDPKNRETAQVTLKSPPSAMVVHHTSPSLETTRDDPTPPRSSHESNPSTRWSHN